MTLLRGRRQRRQDTDPEAPRLTRESLPVLRRVTAYLRPYRRWLLFAIITLLFSAGLGLILPLVIRNLVDVVLIQSNLARLNQLAVGLLGVFVLQALASFANRLILAYMGERIVADIRMKCTPTCSGFRCTSSPTGAPAKSSRA